MSFEDDELRSSAVETVHDEDADLDRSDLEQAVAAAEAGRDPGIALLLELARTGKIDPWNIDIIQVTDEYMRILAQRGATFAAPGRNRLAGETVDPRDLARSARCIFYAAALLHLKARALAEKHSLARLDAALAGDALDDADLRGLRPGDLELIYPDADAILTPRERRPRARGVTLVDLILALKSFDERLAQREALLIDIPAFDEEIAQDECLGITHQDDVERDKGPLRELLAARFAAGHSANAFGECGRGIASGAGVLVDHRELVGEGRSRVAVFLALLSMSNDNEVVLEQAELYGTLLVGIGPDFGRPRVAAPTPDRTEITLDETPVEETS